MTRSHANLSEAFLEQSPGCRWTVDSKFVFQRIYGDSLSFFGKPTRELMGQAVGEIWRDRFARVFRGESEELHERSGAGFWSISVFPIRINGAIEFAAGVARPLSAGDDGKNRQADRSMIARFLHDSVGQNLTALGLQLDLVRMELEAAPEMRTKRIVEIQQMLQRMIEEVREYIYGVTDRTE